MRNSPLYEQDFYAWANEQVALLRAGRLAEADIEHIAEEIESMGKLAGPSRRRRVAEVVATIQQRIWRELGQARNASRAVRRSRNQTRG